MRHEGEKATESNAPEMWDRYHRSPLGSVTHALGVLKTTVVCRMFASRILAMAGAPVRSVLELGCGTASTLACIQRRTGARCVGVDRSPEAVAIARRDHPRLEVTEGDIFALPFADRSFDLVYSVGLLEHFSRADQRALLDIHERLAARYVALMVPADSLLMNSILTFNKRVLGRSGTWADEEVFSGELLARNFPERRFDDVGMDRRFANLILWFGWRPAAAAAPDGGRP